MLVLEKELLKGLLLLDFHVSLAEENLSLRRTHWKKSPFLFVIYFLFRLSSCIALLFFPSGRYQLRPHSILVLLTYYIVNLSLSCGKGSGDEDGDQDDDEDDNDDEDN